MVEKEIRQNVTDASKFAPQRQEYLVGPLKGSRDAIENDDLKVVRVKHMELPIGDLVFPLAISTSLDKGPPQLDDQNCFVQGSSLKDKGLTSITEDPDNIFESGIDLCEGSILEYDCYHFREDSTHRSLLAYVLAQRVRLISVEHAFSKLPERCLDRLVSEFPYDPTSEREYLMPSIFSKTLCALRPPAAFKRRGRSVRQQNDAQTMHCFPGGQQGRLQASLREGEGGDEPMSAESIADASDITMEPTVDAPLALKDATASGFLPPEEPLLGADDDDIDHASEAGAQPLLEDPLAVEDSNLPSTVTPLLTGSSSPDQPPDSAPLIDEDTTQGVQRRSAFRLFFRRPVPFWSAGLVCIGTLREKRSRLSGLRRSQAMSYSQALGAMRFLSTISWQEPKSEQLNSLANIKDTSAHNVPSRLFYQLRFTPRLAASENMPTAFTALFGAQFVDQMTLLDVTAKKIMDAWKKWRKDRLEIKKWSHRSTSPGRRRIHSYQASITLIDNLTGVEQTWKTEDADGDDWPYGILTDRFKEQVKERHMQQMFIEEFVPMISTYPYIRRLIPGEETSKLIPDPLPVYIQLPTLSGWLTGNNSMDLSHHGREKWVYASNESKDRGPIHSIGGRRGDQIDQLNFVGQSSVPLPEHGTGGEEMPEKVFQGKICGLDVGYWKDWMHRFTVFNSKNAADSWSLFDMGHRTAPAGSLSYGFCRIAPLSGYAGPSVECTRRYNIALVIDFTQDFCFASALHCFVCSPCKFELKAPQIALHSEFMS
ncbi:unnamed protein product [Symbiodinium necroappetens]|uniref:Uncharacterized protein n=1 Tax=Symbiodinium necroappetens TaxID=1628268 RepID=A0A812M006_9DINO|nr:unnamed protein product [Symbiodinium necroappetens]